MRTAAVVAVMVIAAGVHAQSTEGTYFGDVRRYERIDLVRVGRAYAGALGSENGGVVESALAQAAMMKLVLPAADCHVVREMTRRIARTAGSQELRYKAHLTGMVLDEPEIFRGMHLEGYGAADELFGALASKLAKHYAEQ
jgi:hypothetical protein